MARRSMGAASRRWARWAVGLIVVLQVDLAHAEIVVRKPSEPDDDFMARVLGPSAELAQELVRSTELAGGRLTLIGLVNDWDKSDGKSAGGSLVGHLLVETSPSRYEHVKFPSCEEEGNAPLLLAVFFARTIKGATASASSLSPRLFQYDAAERAAYFGVATKSGSSTRSTSTSLASAA